MTDASDADVHFTVCNKTIQSFIQIIKDFENLIYKILDAYGFNVEIVNKIL